MSKTEYKNGVIQFERNALLKRFVITLIVISIAISRLPDSSKRQLMRYLNWNAISFRERGRDLLSLEHPESSKLNHLRASRNKTVWATTTKREIRLRYGNKMEYVFAWGGRTWNIYFHNFCWIIPLYIKTPGFYRVIYSARGWVY